MASSSSNNGQRIAKSMQGISLIKVQGRTFRVATPSLDNNNNYNNRSVTRETCKKYKTNDKLFFPPHPPPPTQFPPPIDYS